MFLLAPLNFRKARFILGLSAVCAGVWAFQAHAQDYDYNSGGASGDAAAAEIRIQQFETQIRELTGKIEEQGYQIRQLQEQLEKATTDLSLRVDDLEKNRSAGTAPSIESPDTSSSGVMETEPPPATAQDGSYQWDSTREGSGATPGQLGTLNQSGGATDSAAQQYENAFAALKSGDYSGAESGFRSFIEKNPNHVLAGNAKYWLGETYYVRGDFQSASRVFAEAYQKYPKSSKAPDNLLKLGMSLASLNKKDDACIALGQIERQYAMGAGPVLNRAKQEMSRLGC